MKIIKINNKDYIIKFTSKAIQELNAKGITLFSLIEDMEKLKIDNLYDTFFYSLKYGQHDITIDTTLAIVDDYYAESEDNDMETFFKLILSEYASAMGLGKKFREIMGQQEQGKVVEVIPNKNL